MNNVWQFSNKSLYLLFVILSKNNGYFDIFSKYNLYPISNQKQMLRKTFSVLKKYTRNCFSKKKKKSLVIKVYVPIL